MRVLLVSHRFPPDDVGGVERYTQSLAAELRRRGDGVAIFARRSVIGRKDVRLVRERLRDGTSLYRLIAGNFSFDQFLENHQRLEQSFMVALMESCPDVVHVNHLMGLSPRFIELAHRVGAAIVISLHDFYFVCPRVHLNKPQGELCRGPDAGVECARTCFTAKAEQNRLRWGVRNIYFRQALTMAERIICYSEYVGSYFRNLLTDNVSIEIIPNGIAQRCDRLDLSLHRDPGAALRIAYCGTVAPHKGPHIILDALRIAKFAQVSLLVIGHFPDSHYAKRLREAAATIPGLNFRMYGSYEPRELPFLLSDVDCVVVPSLVPEAGPIVPREALALGVPVLAAKLGALPELIREGKNGFTFDSKSPTELAMMLSRIAADDKLRSCLRAGARTSPLVTVAEHAEMVRSIYSDAIQDLSSKSSSATNTAEFQFLHKALLELGCDPTWDRARI
jgi:glycosyltransferase involved in cell wall biosynthesis